MSSFACNSGDKLGQSVKLGRTCYKNYSKAKRILNTIKAVADEKWGGDWKTLKKLYNAVSRSKMTLNVNCTAQLPLRL